MRIDIVEASIRASYGGGAKECPLDPTLGRVEGIAFDQTKPGKVMVKIWTGFHDAEEFIINNTIVQVLLGVDISRHDLTVNKGDYVEVSGVGWLGLKPHLTPITEGNLRLPPLIQILEWAKQNPNKTLLG